MVRTTLTHTKIPEVTVLKPDFGILYPIRDLLQETAAEVFHRIPHAEHTHHDYGDKHQGYVGKMYAHGVASTMKLPAEPPSLIKPNCC